MTEMDRYVEELRVRVAALEGALTAIQYDLQCYQGATPGTKGGDICREDSVTRALGEADAVMGPATFYEEPA